MNSASFGKSGMYIAGITVLTIFFVKLLVVPFISHLYTTPFFVALRFWVYLIENLAIFNIIAFFLCIIFFKKQIGSKLLYAMQLKDKRYFKDKWILHWLSSIWVCIGIIGITTVITQALFKSWGSFIILLLIISIPYYILPKIKHKFKLP